MKKNIFYVKLFALMLLFLRTGAGYAQCPASFTVTYGPNGVVLFTSTSASTTASSVYNWNFGNTFSANNTSLSAVTSTYNANGTYTVTLSVYNSVPTCSSQVTQTISVTNVTAPACNLTPSLSASIGAGGFGSFYNASTGTSPNSTFTLNYGDGSGSFTTTNVSTVHSYSLNGFYTVTLTASNNYTPNTCVASYTLLVNVNNACAVIAGFTVFPGANGSATFVSTSTGTTATTSYTWNPGNNTSITQGTGIIANATTYNANGVYTVSLSASNGTCTSTSIQTINITNVTAPVCNLTATAVLSYSTNGGLNCQNFSTGTSPATSYTWSFGDGSANVVTTSTVAFAHTYTANGTYTLLLTGSNNYTSSICASTYTAIITISSVCSLTPAFTVTPGAGGTLLFTNGSTGTISATSYTIAWGDGNFNGANPHTYAANGVYIISLIAYNGPGCTFTVSQTATITTVPPCTLSVQFTLTPGANGLVTYSNTSTGTVSATTFTMNWGDGNINSASAHTYSTNGVYVLTLYASNSSACSSSTAVTYTVSNVCNLFAAFTSTGYANGHVFFTSTSAGTNTNTIYTWVFPPTGSATATGNTGINDSTIYTASGVYTVSLILLNPATSCTASAVHTINVTACNLAAQFSLTAGNNNTVLFTNLSTGTTSSNGYTLSWGDGTFNGSSPHTYTSAGNHTVTLSLSTSPGNFSCYSSVSHVITSTPCALSANFSLTPGSNGSVSYVNQTTNTVAATTYTMAWGDGTFNGTLPHQYTLNGIYSPTLFASNNSTNGCTSSMTQSISITSVSCTPINPGFTFTTGTFGSVLYTSTSTGTTASTVYNWASDTYPTPSLPNNFGTSTTASEVFNVNGIYAVTLTVYNSATPSCSFSVTHTLSVSNAIPPCSASFTYAVGSGYSVTFGSTSTGTTSYSHYNWHFGDSLSGTGQTTSHSYTASGTYWVNLILTDSATNTSCLNTQTISIPPIASCSLHAALAHTVGAGGYMDCESASTGTTSAATYTWRFGDGYYSVGNPMSHTYMAGGAYQLMLLVNDGACADSVVQSVNITGLACSANAGFTLVPSGIPQLWYATITYPWNVSSCTWYWGDGDSSNVLYPSHTYSAAGNYSICLRVVLSCGDTATYCAPYYVNRNSSSEAGIVQVNVLRPATVLTSLATTPLNALDYTIYPNPNNGSFTLQMNSSASGKIKTAVYNLVGAQIYERESEPAANNVTQNIDLENAANGVYFIKIFSDAKTYTHKFIINK